MPRTRVGHIIGLPKEIVVAMLAAALTVTVAVDLTGSRRQPEAVDATVPAAVLHATTSVPSTVPPTTTVPSTVPPTSAPAPPVKSVVAKTPVPTPVKPAPVAARSAPRTAQSVPFGVYVGSGDPSGVASFAAATGTHPTYASDYLPTDEGWAGISN
ncbi:MAG TPA: hypothetical protein VK283_07560, partial [Acidimicrobiales bacterium]|nr:hypothetical protein [Acidimicrobiales bacterium]